MLVSVPLIKYELYESGWPLEGTSFLPVLKNPNKPWKSAVFSQYPRSLKGHRHSKHGDIMGYALRTKRYRYVEWQDWESKDIVGRELYDFKDDSFEISNIAEVNKYKFNRYTPGSKIKIVSEKSVKLKKPDYMLVLPWHFKDYIVKRERDFLKKGGKLIFPLPDIEII